MDKDDNEYDKHECKDDNDDDGGACQDLERDRLDLGNIIEEL